MRFTTLGGALASDLIVVRGAAGQFCSHFVIISLISFCHDNGIPRSRHLYTAQRETPTAWAIASIEPKNFNAVENLTMLDDRCMIIVVSSVQYSC